MTVGVAKPLMNLVYKCKPAYFTIKMKKNAIKWIRVFIKEPLVVKTKYSEVHFHYFCRLSVVLQGNKNSLLLYKVTSMTS